MLALMGTADHSDIKDSLRGLYLEDLRAWFAGSSGGKDSTMPKRIKQDTLPQ